MKKGKLSGLSICAGLLTLALLPGCGSNNSNTAVPTTATIYNNHTVVIRPDGTVMTTGYNGFGQLGTGDTNQLSILTVVPGLTVVPTVPNNGSDKPLYATGGDHTMVAFTNNSSVYTWGSNNHGQIGDPTIATSGTSAASLKPDKIRFRGKVTSIAAGLFHSLAVVDGVIWAWGFNGYGQLGDGTFADKTSPTAQLAIGTHPTDPYLAPAPLTNVIMVAAGTNHSLALNAAGEVYAWGDNRNGQLGADPNLPLNQSSVSPVLVNLSAQAPSGQYVKVDQIAAGGSTSYALGRKLYLADDTTAGWAIWAWGYNGAGQLGVDPQGNLTLYSATPVEIPLTGIDSTKITKISAGLDHLLVLVDDGLGHGTGTVWAIGYDQFGQLGDNAVPTIATISSRATLQQVFLNGTALGPVTDINAFGNRSLALVADGSANGVWYGWGDNGFGQLGNPVPNNSSAFFSTPTKVLGY